MGRKRKAPHNSRTMKRDFKQAREPKWTHDKRVRNEDGTWTVPNTYSNEAFEEFYTAQGIVPEGEWQEFLDTLKTTLPTTFRINAGTKFAMDLRRKLETDLFSKFHDEPVEVDGEMVPPPKALSWYPDKLAWQFSFSRQQLRRAPELSAIHEFVKRENESGTITRQEAVSMVPPLFLDVLPHHKVLDMCAAPGSKTFQLLEMMHTGVTGTPSGLVVANDSDAQRCNLLTHQTKRHCSPCLLVTNHEGQNFPNITVPGVVNRTMFDRVLCDVPCSGDGTMRKAPDIWNKWTVGNGIALHPLQIRITLHAARLLHVGGRLVYSTCSFNPLENEAVVAEVLRRSNGCLRLVDVEGMLPELRRGPGLTSWKVKDKQKWIESWEDVKEEKGSKIFPSMFPADDLAALNIPYCMRFLPHHQDTGGFFVCLLEKVSHGSMDEMLTKKARQGVRAAEKAAVAKAAGEQEAAAEAEAEAEAAAVASAAAGEGDDTVSIVSRAAVGSNALDAQTEKEPSEAQAGGAVSSAAPVESAAAEGNNGQVASFSAPAVAGNGNKMAIDNGAGETIDEVEGNFKVGDSSVRTMGKGAVVHDGTIDSDAEGGVAGPAAALPGSSGGGTSSAQASLRAPQQRLVGGAIYQHHNQSACTAPVAPPSGLEPALSVGQSASAETVAAVGASVSVADDGMATSRLGSTAVGGGGGGGGDSTLAGLVATAETSGKEVSKGEPAEEADVTSAPPSAQDSRVLPPVPQWGARGGGGRNREGGGGKWRGMDPILPVSNRPLLDSIYDFYGLPESFPMRELLITRSTDTTKPPKRLYFVSTGVRDVLAADEDEKLKIHATGVKVMERQEGKDGATVKCCYRIVQEGLPCLLPFLTKQIIRPSLETFMLLLKERSFPLPYPCRAIEGAELDEKRAAEAAAAKDGAEGVKEEPKQEEPKQEDAAMEDAAETQAKEEKEDKVVPTKAVLEDKEILEQLKAVRMGGCVAILKDEDALKLGVAGGLEDSLAVCLYRGMSSINILVSKQEAAQLLEKIQFSLDAAKGATGESSGPSGTAPAPAPAGSTA